MTPSASTASFAGGTVRSAYLWTAASNVFKQGMLFAVSLLLAKLLTPADYGLVGMVTALMVILIPLQDLAIPQAISYFREQEEQILPNAIVISTAMGALLFVAMFVSADFVANFYSAPVLAPIVRVMSTTFLFTGVRATSYGMMMKQFGFKRIALIEFVTIVIASAVAIAMAWRGFGVWSLVTNYMLSVVIQTAMTLYYVPPRWPRELSAKTTKVLLRWSLPPTGASMLGQFSANVDYLIIGKMLGSEQLGLYTLAFRFANIAAEKVAGIVNRVSFPALAALRNEPRGAARHWLQLLEVLGLVCFPLIVAMGVNARDAIGFVLGDKWVPAVPTLQLLCWMGALKVVAPVTANLISTSGRTDIIFRVTLINSLVLPPTFVAACWLAGGKGVAIAWAVVYTPIVVYQFQQATKLAHVPAWKLWEALRLPILVATSYAVPGIAIAVWMDPGIARLGVNIAVFAGVLGLLMLRPQVRATVRRIVRK